MTKAEELSAMEAEAEGDLALLLGLVALRRIENGGPGREFGVLSEPAPTFMEQLEIAADSFRHSEVRAVKRGIIPRRADTGFYTREFLKFFSARWAPPRADNDPNNMNADHAENLVRVHLSMMAKVTMQLALILEGT